MTKNVKAQSVFFGSIALALLFVFSAQSAQAQGFKNSPKPQSGPSKVSHSKASNNWGHHEKSPNFGSFNRPGYSHQNNKAPQHFASHQPNYRPNHYPNHQPNYRPQPHHPQPHHVSRPAPSHHCPPQVVVVGQQRPSLLDRIIDILH